MTNAVAQNDKGVKRLARFTLMNFALIGTCYLVLSLGFESPLERRALAISACLAASVQLVAFSMVEWFRPDNALVGWGLGALLRGTVLAVYGLSFAPMLGLPLTPALVGFVVCLFASMILESLLLAYDR